MTDLLRISIERQRAIAAVRLLGRIRREDPELFAQIKEFAKFDGNVERHSTNREACKTEKELTDISSPRRLRVKGTDTDSQISAHGQVSQMGCRMESGETGIQVSDGPSEDRPIAQSARPGEPLHDSRQPGYLRGTRCW